MILYLIYKYKKSSITQLAPKSEFLLSLKKKKKKSLNFSYSHAFTENVNVFVFILFIYLFFEKNGGEIQT